LTPGLTFGANEYWLQSNVRAASALASVVEVEGVGDSRSVQVLVTNERIVG
jgi:hypothetical protein